MSLLIALISLSQADAGVDGCFLPQPQDWAMYVPAMPVAEAEFIVGWEESLTRTELARLPGAGGVADRLGALPGTWRDASGQLRLRDMAAGEVAVVLDGVWLDGVALASPRAAEPGAGLIAPRGVAVQAPSTPR
jgi:hypothetical protein